MTPSWEGGALQVVDLLVDLIGIEPVTSSKPWKRAPSCATGPLLGRTAPILRSAGHLVKRVYSVRWARAARFAQRDWQQAKLFPSLRELIAGLRVSKANRVSEHSAAGGEVS